MSQLPQSLQVLLNIFKVQLKFIPIRFGFKVQGKIAIEGRFMQGRIKFKLMIQTGSTDLEQ